jgi:hypothetical protein
MRQRCGMFLGGGCEPSDEFGGLGESVFMMQSDRDAYTLGQIRTKGVRVDDADVQSLQR